MTLEAALDAVRWRGTYGRQVATNRSLAQLDDRCYSCRMEHGAETLARLLSEELGGQWFVGPTSVTWQMGSRTTWLLAQGTAEHLPPVRAVLKRLGITEIPWTLGGCARRVLKLAGPPDRTSVLDEYLRDQGEWGYHCVQPGTYSERALWDLSGCHYQLLCRLPSLHLTPYRDALCWHPLEQEHSENWLRALIEIGDQKALRNAVVGAMIGGDGGAKRYIRGEEVPMPKLRGPFRAAGLLIVRTAYELTGLQAREQPTVYANTDCVMVKPASSLGVWDSYQMRYRLKAQGEADVQALGIYRCGDTATRSYRANRKVESDACETPLPKVLRIRQWM